MASRRNQGAGVRGPNSALTEFLRSRGISAADIASRAAARAAAAQAEQANNPEPVEETNAQASTSTAGVAEAGPSTPASVSKKKSKRRKKGDGEDSAFNPYKKSIPTPGQIAFCEECNCRFTVTAYSRPGPDGEGLLCNPCGSKDAKANKQEKKTRATGKRVKKTIARQTLDGEKKGPKSLKELCISIIAKYIDDVEALGDIGQMNMDRICQIISRNRRLNNDTLKLFIDPGSIRLNLYDCSKIDANDLRTIASFVPTLRHLSLLYCGRMTNEVLTYYGEKLTALTSLALRGPFLVTKDTYISFFKVIGERLTSFTVTDTARVDVDVINALIDNCPNLTELRLSNLLKLDDEAIRLLTGLQKLEILEISSPGLDITDEPIIDVLNSVGSGLKELNLRGCMLLTDAVLSSIRACCGRLTFLCLDELELLTDEGMTSLFTNWTLNHGLSQLDLCRVIELQDTAFEAILNHSGSNLEVLNVNSCRLLTANALSKVTGGRLEELDVGFCRTVDDAIVEGIVERCEALKVVKVWGCPRITQTVKVGRVSIVGREADLLA